MRLSIYRPLDQRPTLWSHKACLIVVLLYAIGVTISIYGTLFVAWQFVFGFWFCAYKGAQIALRHRPMEATDD
jgi:hypothetical protein